MMTRMICTPYRLDLTSVPRPPAGNNSLVSGCWIVEQGKPPNPFPALSLTLVPPARDEVLAQSRTLVLFPSSPTRDFIL